VANEHIKTLQDLRLGVEMDKHNLDDGEEKLVALDAAIAALRAQPAAATPCQNASMGKHACTSREQCWESCGELGNSAEHARVAPAATVVGDYRVTLDTWFTRYFQSLGGMIYNPAPLHMRAAYETGYRAALAAAAVQATPQDAEDAARYRWLRDWNDWYAEPRLDREDGTRWSLTFYTPAPLADPPADDSLDVALIAAMLADAAQGRSHG
jgi:hypothetical protein